MAVVREYRAYWGKSPIIDPTELAKLYLVNGWTKKGLMAHFDVSESTVKRHLRAHWRHPTFFILLDYLMEPRSRLSERGTPVVGCPAFYYFVVVAMIMLKPETLSLSTPSKASAATKLQVAFGTAILSQKN